MSRINEWFDLKKNDNRKFLLKTKSNTTWHYSKKLSSNCVSTRIFVQHPLSKVLKTYTAGCAASVGVSEPCGAPGVTISSQTCWPLISPSPYFPSSQTYFLFPVSCWPEHPVLRTEGCSAFRADPRPNGKTNPLELHAVGGEHLFQKQNSSKNTSTLVDLSTMRIWH